MADFNIHDFLLTTVTGLVSHRPDYNVREMAAGWYSKGVFSADDVSAVESAIQAQYVAEAASEESTDETENTNTTGSTSE